jgi:hypothetical protein
MTSCNASAKILVTDYGIPADVGFSKYPSVSKAADVMAASRLRSAYCGRYSIITHSAFCCPALFLSGIDHALARIEAQEAGAGKLPRADSVRELFEDVL